MNMGNMDMGSTSAESSPSSKTFETANQKMHSGMSMSFAGNTDIDFGQGMIPHHQGAIAMAKVKLQYVKDPEIRKLVAKDIIKAQEIEIVGMNARLARRKKRVAGISSRASPLARPGTQTLLQRGLHSGSRLFATLPPG
jgi:uncharacterized protein (DUF305 family)